MASTAVWNCVTVSSADQEQLRRNLVQYPKKVPLYFIPLFAEC